LGALAKNILIVELWGLGDLVLMSSVLDRVKSLFPEASITLLAKSYAQELFKYDKRIDEVVCFDFPWTAFREKYRFFRWPWKSMCRIIKELRKKNFDFVLDARCDPRNDILLTLLKVRRRLGYNFFVYSDRCSIRSNHRVAAWHELLRRYGFEGDMGIPRLIVTDKEREWARSFIYNSGFDRSVPVVGIHPGARIKIRSWPMARFEAVADGLYDKYGAQFVIFVEPHGYGRDFTMKGRPIFFKGDLREMMALMCELDLLICNDGGAMHIAAGVGLPVAAVFGPSDPVRFSPWGDIHKVIIKEGYDCRPCFDYCKRETPECILDVTVDEVLEVVGNMLRVSR
jgi:ADP-heptose:LPS heptosyltransferase